MSRTTVVLLLFLITGSCIKKQSDRFVSINGRNQHILELGSGTPIVVFVHGFGNDLTSFTQVQKEISNVTHTVSYDRAGFGKSELLDSARSMKHYVDELNAILEKESMQSPYLLVGHSWGGHIIRYFSHVYPEKVAGLFLIDPSVEDLDEELRKLYGDAAVYTYDSLYEHYYNPTWSEGNKRDQTYFRRNELTMKEVKFSDSIPVTILSATTRQNGVAIFRESARMVNDLHKRWQEEAPHMRYVAVPNSGHAIQIDQPALVVSEIKSMMETLRKNQ